MTSANTGTVGTNIATRPPLRDGVVEYKPSPMQQQVIDLLKNPSALSVIQPLVPKGVDLDAVVIEVYRAAAINPDILKCTEASIVMAVADCLRAGLIIGKTIHLVPVSTKVSKRNEADRYEDRLQAWTDYKGDVELVIGSGAARSVYAYAVYENDRFDFTLGTDPHVDHRPAFGKERGKMIGAYAVAIITAQVKKVCVMSIDQIEQVRAKSRQWARAAECPEWYALKTTIHRVTKDIPKNPRLAHVLALFERQDAIEHEDGGFDLDPSQRVEPTSASASATESHQVSDAGENHRAAPNAAQRAPASAPSPTEAAPAKPKYPDVPPCPGCGGAVWDNRKENDARHERGERLRPDFACKNRNHCDGKYWRGEWPPQTTPPAAEDDSDMLF